MKIILVSHGDFAHGLIKSYQMIAGSAEHLSAIDLNEAGIADFSQRLTTLLEKGTEGDQVIILADLKGGTPYNESYRYFLSNSQNVRVLSGMNLPMLLEIGLSLSGDQTLDQLVAIGLAAGKAGIEEVAVDETGTELEF